MKFSLFEKEIAEEDGKTFKVLNFTVGKYSFNLLKVETHDDYGRDYICEVCRIRIETGEEFRIARIVNLIKLTVGFEMLYWCEEKSSFIDNLEEFLKELTRIGVNLSFMVIKNALFSIYFHIVGFDTKLTILDVNSDEYSNFVEPN